MLILRKRADTGYTILSEEGVTQGDPLSMILYGLALVPLAERLKEAVPDVVQPWYADDAAMAGPASRIRTTMKLLMKWGPARGYFPEPAKSIVVVDDTQRERCQVLLREFDFRYTDGHRYVGGYIGSDKARSDWIDPQIQQWVKGIKALAKVARRYPQTAYAGLQKSLQSEWMYLQRVTDRVSDDFAPIERAIQEDFLPALFDARKEEIAEMRPLLALSVRRAGLGIPVPTLSGPPSYRTSTQCTAMLTQSLLTGGPFSVADYQADNKAERIAAQRERAGREELVLKGIVESAPPQPKASDPPFHRDGQLANRHAQCS